MLNLTKFKSGINYILFKFMVVKIIINFSIKKKKYINFISFIIK